MTSRLEGRVVVEPLLAGRGRAAVLALGLLLGGAAAARAQTPFYYQWGPRDGLVQYSVSVITQDEHGYIWLGTEGGASRFSGRTFDSFTASNGATSGPVPAIVVDRGRVLLTSEAGRLYEVAGSRVTELPAPAPLVGVVPAAADGPPWLVTAAGLVALPGAPSLPYPPGVAPVPDQRVPHAVVDGTLYIALGRTVLRVLPRGVEVVAACDGLVVGLLGGPGSGLEVVLPGELRAVDLATGRQRTVLEAPAGMSFTCAASGPGRRVIGTGGGALVVVRDDGTSEVMSRGLPANAVMALYYDREGNLWAGLDSGGILLLPTTAFASYTTADGLRTPDAFYLIRDRVRGGVWVGTRNGGVAHIRGSHVRALTDADGLPSNHVRALHQTASGEVLVGTDNGIARLGTDDRVRALTVACGQEFRFFFEGSDGVVWAGSQEGSLVRLDAAGARCLDTAALPHPVSLNAMTAHGGVLYLGTSRGVFALAADGTFGRPLCDGAEVRGFAASGEGELWVATRAAGAWRLRGDGWEHHGPAEGFDELVRFVAVSPGGVPSFGSDRGVWSFPDPRGTRITERDGLASGNVYLLRFDPEGRLWVGTDRGLNVVEGGRVTAHLDYRDGLADNELNANGFVADEAGRLWFCTMKGVSCLEPRAVAERGAPPLLDLRLVEANGTAVDLEPGGPTFAPLRLAHDRNTLRFVFSGQSFRNPTRLTYSFMLEGLDDDWSRPAAAEHAVYTKVPPGRYTFRVRCAGAGGASSETLALPVEIVPALWQRPAVGVLAGLACLAAVVGALQRRTRRVEARNVELESIVQARTRQLGERRDQLERINELVKAINSRQAFADLLGFLLQHGGIISGVDSGAALVWDREREVFRFLAALGWSVEELAGVEFTAEEARQRYTAGAEEVFEDIFVLTRRGGHVHDAKFPRDPGWKAMLVLRIRLEGRVDGYLIFDSLKDENAFAVRDLLLLVALKEHILSAFWKTRALEDLKALNEKKDEFLGLAAHDLRSPLSLIHGWASVLISQISEDRFDKARSLRELGRMVVVTEQLSEMVSDLLDISAIESGRLVLHRQPEDLGAVLEECEQLYARSAADKGIALTVAADRSLPPVLADRDRVVEVVSNLLSNAVKFTPRGGQVRVSTEALEREVVTRVTDTGVGLDEDELRTVFRRFGRLSARPASGEAAAGLGLAIVKKIVEAHGGRVWAESRKGVGSTFSFSLPVA